MAQNKDYFVDLTPYINEETMPNLTKAMEECPELRAACTDRDGKIYSLPKKLPLRPTVCGSGLYINQTWLDNLGLEAPKTLDELTDVLLALQKRMQTVTAIRRMRLELTNNAGNNLQADSQHILSVWGWYDKPCRKLYGSEQRWRGCICSGTGKL